MSSFASFIDGLAKQNKKSKMPSGGEQYTMEVALGPSASAKNQALMRVAKPQIEEPMPLKKLMAKCQKSM